jgi:hypothetical protein
MIPSQVRKGKFSERAKKGLFMGYEETGRGYRVWDPVDKKILHSRDVKFVEREANVGKSSVHDLLDETHEHEDSTDSEDEKMVVSWVEHGKDRERVNTVCEGEHKHSDGFWEVGDNSRAVENESSTSSVQGEAQVQVEVHRSGNECEIEELSDGESLDDEPARWVRGGNLRSVNEKLKPSKYGLAFKSIFDDSESDECDLRKYAPRV